MNYKLLFCCYRCPMSLHHIYPDASDICCRCHSAKGSLLHFWWECPQIYEFLDWIMQLYTTVTRGIASNMPHTTLLSILPGSFKHIKRGLLKHWLTAARSVILHYWRSTQSSLCDWVGHRDGLYWKDGVPDGLWTGYTQTMPLDMGSLGESQQKLWIFLWNHSRFQIWLSEASSWMPTPGCFNFNLKLYI